MIRAVLAVALAAALLGASLPALDDARRSHSGTVVRTELDRFERAARSLLETDDPVDGNGARRVVTLSLPAERWTDAGIRSVTVASSTESRGGGGRLAWTVRGGRQRVRHLPNVPLRTPSGEPLSLSSPGRHRLALSLDGSRTEPVVTVRRFTRQDGASATHATVATDARRRIDRRVRLRSGVRR